MLRSRLLSTMRATLSTLDGDRDSPAISLRRVSSATSAAAWLTQREAVELVDLVQARELRQLEPVDVAQAQDRPLSLRERGERRSQRVAELGPVQVLEVVQLRVGLAAHKLGQDVLAGRTGRSDQVERHAQRRHREPAPQRPAPRVVVDPDAPAVGDEQPHPQRLADLVDERRCAIDPARGGLDVGRDQLLEMAQRRGVPAPRRPGQEQLAQVLGPPTSLPAGLGVGCKAGVIHAHVGMRIARLLQGAQPADLGARHVQQLTAG